MAGAEDESGGPRKGSVRPVAILSSDFIRKIAQALEEEDTDVYTLELYAMNSEDLDYFSQADQKKIARIFKVLAQDTKRHAELLKLIVEMGTP